MNNIGAMETMLVYCPICGKKLEKNPVSLNKACFMHGDFVVTEDQIVEGKQVVITFEMRSKA
jgi:hypothetical protein